MTQRQLLENLTPQDWTSQKPGTTGQPRVRWLQSLVDLTSRFVNNRVTASTNATAVVCNGAAQSTGVGTAQITPMRYAELMVKARVTFNLSAAGTLFVYVYRTIGAIPANGAAPGGGDVIVAGDAFAGGSMASGVNQCGSLAFIDQPLSTRQAYRYYLAVKGTNALTANLVNNSQLMVSEL